MTDNHSNKDQESKDNLQSEILRLLATGKAEDKGITPNHDHLSHDEVGILNAVRDFKEEAEFEFIKHRLASDALGIALWDIDILESIPVKPDTKVTWSKEIRKLLGFDDESDFPNVFSSLLERAHPDDAELVSIASDAHLFDTTGRTPFDLICRYKMKSGEYRYFRSFGTASRDSKGVPVRFAGAIMDIDDHKQLETERAQALETLQNLVNGLDAYIYATVPDTCEILFMNENMKQHYGISGDVIGKICYEVLQEGMTEKCDFCPTYKLDKDPDSVVVWQEHSELTKRIYRNTDRYIEWVDGKKAHIQHSVDITDTVEKSKQLEIAIKEVHEANELRDNTLNALESILNSIDAMIYVTIPDTGELLFINAYMRKLFQIEGLDTTGKYCYHLFRQGFESMCEFCPCYELEKEPDKTIVWDEHFPELDVHIRHTDSLIEWHDGQKVHLQHAIDITDIMRSQESMRKMSEEIKEMQDREMQRLENLVEERTQELVRDIAKRKELERKMTHSIERSKTLTDALSNVTKSPDIYAGDLKAAADVIVREGCIALGVSRVGVWRLSENAKTLKSISCFDSKTGEHLLQSDFDLTNRKAFAKSLLTERMIVTVDVGKLKYDIFSDGYSPNVCALLDAPIHIDGKLVGLVCVEQDHCEEYETKREWLVEEQSFTSSLADLMALAISGYERHLAREAAETANKAKSAFLASMSHEIRTPMNAILGVTDIMIQKESLPDDIEEGLDRIYNSCDMLLSIINDLLDFSKIEAGKMDMLPAQYKVASMINDAVQLNMMRIHEKPIKFELHVDEKIPATLIGDELRIKQILNNVLSNAFKYTEKGQVTFSVISEDWPGGGGTTLVLVIKDTGRGMTEEQLAKLFDEYSRFREESSQYVEGTGLGLAITLGLVNMMNGSISVESKPDEGSTFTVRIPQKSIGKALLGTDVAKSLEQLRVSYITRRKRGQILRSMMPYGKVLAVDDMEPNLYVAVGLLRPYGLHIETVTSGQAAIDLVSSGKSFDIIFMDHMMPEMDGIEATARLRALGYLEPIVALTANAVSGQEEAFLKNGFDDFISKPVDIRQLNSVLNKYIRDKYPQEAALAEQAQAEQAKADISAATVDPAEKLADALTGDTSGDGASVQEQSNADLKSRVIKGLDIARGVEQHGGNEKNYLTVLRSYTASARSVLADMEIVNEEKLDEYKLMAHGIKGTSRSIFAERIGNLAADLEAAAIERDIGFIKKHNSTFLEAATIFLDDIDDLISSIDTQKTRPVKDKPDAELLDQLVAACREYNMTKADEIMDQIDEYAYELDDGLAIWLRDKINLMNYSQIIDKLTEA